MGPQQSIAHYRIVSKLGEGGMGEVWRATDTKLNREVAIKILPDAFAGDPDRLARFTREAQLLASLNHPNIAAIYGVEDRALVMELVEGTTLAERIAQGPIPVDEALPIARQIAEALEYAHERGIIHRDLKPANIKLTPDGRVKVLDFGLAKAVEGATGPGADPVNSPTLTLGATEAGVILGTAAYMAPEQAAGKGADRRSDVWSFGAVLFEILTGRRAFDGDSVSETLASVLKVDPDWNTLPSASPPSLRRLVRRCLTRDRRRRLQSIGEARIVLEDLWNGATEETAAGPAATPSRRSAIVWTVAGFAASAALLVALLWLREPASEPRLIRFSVLPPGGAEFDTTSPPALSPDGRRLAFVAFTNNQLSLWLQDLDTLNPRQLPGTEGARQPFWSPDSRSIAFFTLGRLKKIDIFGGPPQTLCEATNTPRGGSWGKHDVIVFCPAPTGGLLRVSASGGRPSPATDFDGAVEFSHRWPAFLPDGERFLYSSGIVGSGIAQQYQDMKIYAADVRSKGRRQVLVSNTNAMYSPPGLLLFMRERTLLAQRFDAAKLATSGDAVPIAEQVDRTTDQVVGLFSASQNGILAYMAGGAGEQTQLTWIDRTGKVTGTLGPPDYWRWPAISPDGKTVAADRLDPQTGRRDIWMFSLERGAAARFTFGPRTNALPLWSPDGSRIVFESIQDDGGSDIFWKGVDGSSEEALERSKIRKRAAEFSPDGRYVIEEVGGNSGKTAIDLWLLPTFGRRQPIPYLDSPASERYPRISPNGKWLAYDSDETKQREIYVQSFPAPGVKRQISVAGGAYPLWSRTGEELFFIGLDDTLMAVDVKAGERFEASAPRPLFRVHLSAVNRRIDVGRDGRFLMPVPITKSDIIPITVVVNWTAALKNK